MQVCTTVLPKTVHEALSSAIDHIDGNVTEESGLALAYTSARKSLTS